MGVLDIVVCVVLGGCTLYGLVRGFAHIALGIAGFGLGLAAALRLAENGPAWFGGRISNPSTARLLAFLLVFVASLLVTALVIWIAGKLIRAAGIGWMDRLLGAAVGFGGGLLVVLGAMLALTAFLPAGTSFLRGSTLVPRLLGGVDLASGILPPSLAEAYHARRQALVGAPEQRDAAAETKEGTPGETKDGTAETKPDAAPGAKPDAGRDGTTQPAAPAATPATAKSAPDATDATDAKAATASTPKPEVAPAAKPAPKHRKAHKAA